MTDTFKVLLTQLPEYDCCVPLLHSNISLALIRWKRAGFTDVLVHDSLAAVHALTGSASMLCR